MQILGVTIDNFSKEEILNKINFFLEDNQVHQIATINPEFILRAQEDRVFMDILNNCELRVADGAGIWFACLRFGNYLKKRFTGVDIVQEILHIANKKGLAIFLVASDTGLSDWRETRKAILRKYPALKIKGANVSKNNIVIDSQDINCPIIFCALGAPYQEKFLHSLKSTKNDKIRLTIGVGGGFDFLTNKIRRAPKVMRKVGLEWLWRFMQEPRYRVRRIYNAIILFPIKTLFNK